MTTHIVKNNYHNGFRRTDIFEKRNVPDSIMLNFMNNKGVNNIQITDSLIEYHYYFVPVFGKRKEIHFDFSLKKKKETYKRYGAKQVILEEGIYYIEY